MTPLQSMIRVKAHLTSSLDPSRRFRPAPSCPAFHYLFLATFIFHAAVFPVQSGRSSRVQRSSSRQQGRSWMSMLDMMMVGGVVLLVVLIIARKKR